MKSKSGFQTQLGFHCTLTLKQETNESAWSSCWGKWPLVHLLSASWGISALCWAVHAAPCARQKSFPARPLLQARSNFDVVGISIHSVWQKHQGMKVRKYPLSLNAQVSRVPGVTFRKTRQFTGKILACNSGKRLNTWSISSMFAAGCMKQNFSVFLGSECAKSKKDLLRRRHKCTRATERGQLCQLLF